MPGGTYAQVKPWYKVRALIPRKLDGEWQFLTFLYKREIEHLYYEGVRTEKQYKSEKQYLFDELCGNNY
jgi:hypothetical protein